MATAMVTARLSVETVAALDAAAARLNTTRTAVLTALVHLHAAALSADSAVPMIVATSLAPGADRGERAAPPTKPAAGRRAGKSRKPRPAPPG